MRPDRAGDAHRSGEQRPAGTAPLRPERVVERDVAGADLGEGEHGGDQDRVVFVAAVGRPRPVLEVDAVDRGQHDRGERPRRQRRGESERERRPAAGLGDTGGEGIAPTGPHAESLEHLRGGLEPVSAEPSEQLLGPVPEEKAPDGEPEQQAADLHRSSSLCVEPTTPLSTCR